MTREEITQWAVVFGVGQELRALLVPPTVVDNGLALEFAQIKGGIVYVDGPDDLLTLRCREVWVGDALVLIGVGHQGIGRTGLPLDEVARADDVEFVGWPRSLFEVDHIAPIVNEPNGGTRRVAIP